MSAEKRRFAVWIVILVAAGVAFWWLPLGSWLESVGDWGRRNPVTGTVLYIAIFAVTSVLLVPGSWIAMAGGYLFGLQAGSLLAIAGAAAGALAAFLNGRTLARGWALRRMQTRPNLVAIDHALGRRSFLLVFLSRLSLLIPYNLLNYFYGVTAVRTLPYAVASAIGLVPAMVFYTYVGTLADELGDLASGELETGTAGTLYLASGLVAAVLVVVAVHRIATRALQSQIDAGLQRERGS